MLPENFKHCGFICLEFVDSVFESSLLFLEMESAPTMKKNFNSKQRRSAHFFSNCQNMSLFTCTYCFLALWAFINSQDLGGGGGGGADLPVFDPISITLLSPPTTLFPVYFPCFSVSVSVFPIMSLLIFFLVNYSVV